VIEVIEALNQEVVGLVDVFVESRAGVEKMPGECTLFGYLLLGKK
jgi:hypothetical protein